MTHLEEMIPDYFVPDALTDNERTMIEAHIQSCDTCRDAFEDWARISKAARMRQSAASLPPLRLPEPVISSNGRNAEMNAVLTSPIRRPRPRSVWVTSAALLMMILAGLIILSINSPFNQLTPSFVQTQQGDDELPTAYEWLRDDGRFNELAETIASNPILMTFFTSYEMAFFAMLDDVFEPVDPKSLEDVQGGLTLEDYEWTVVMYMAYPQANVLELMRQLGERRLTYRWRVPLSTGCNVCSITAYLTFHTEDEEVILGETTHIVEANIPVANGVIHVVDSGVKPMESINVPMPSLSSDYDPPTLWDVLREDARTSDFVDRFADFEEMTSLLSMEEPVTLFVPINGEMGELLDNRRISRPSLLYTHTLPGLYSTDMLLDAGHINNPIAEDFLLPEVIIDETGREEIRSPLQAQIAFSETAAGEILINGRSVIVEDNIITPIGIVHLIDKPFTGYLQGDGTIPDAVSRPIRTDTP